MPIVGFSFTRLLIDKKADFTSNEEFSSNVTITKVEEQEHKYSKEDNLANFDFDFHVGYGKAGVIEFNGRIIYMGVKKEVHEIVEGWKKDKTMNSLTLKNILNTILYKCNVRALEMSELVNLPAPFSLPFIRDEEKK